jgi:hypothetical protein
MLRFVFANWFDEDEELWDFLHKGGDGWDRFKKQLIGDGSIRPSGRNKGEQHWEVSIGFRIERGWYAGVVGNEPIDM